MRQALVLFAHGARDPEWAAPFRRIRGLVAARCPNISVELAFLEIMSPSLAEAVDGLAAGGISSITIAPLFMAQGGHLKQDLPRLVADLEVRHPGLELRLLPAVGDVEEVLLAIGEWLAEAMRTPER